MTGTLTEPLVEPPMEIRVDWDSQSCCCCDIAYFPDGGFTMWGHWRRRLRIPIIASVGFLITFASFIYDTYDSCPNRPCTIAALTVTSFLALSIIVAYFATIIRGPGYAPYNWSRMPRTSFTSGEFMDNMVLYKEQQEFARSARRRLRASFGIEARRFVLRADHFCLWGQTWIGIRNHRYFLLMTFYAFLYMACYVGFRVFWLQKTIQSFLDGEKRPRIIVCIIIGGLSMIAVVGSGAFAGYHFAVACRNLIDGQTSVELYKDEPPVFENHTCLDNFEEVCGSRKLLFFWLFPFFVCVEPLSDGFYNSGDGSRPGSSSRNGVPTYTEHDA
jgi:hypothetical protein